MHRGSGRFFHFALLLLLSIGPLIILDLNFQKSLKTLRCQRTTVSGLTMTRDLRQGIQIRERKTQKSRSTLRIFGRMFVRFVTENWCRSARFSAAIFEEILVFDHITKTRSRAVFVMILDWQQPKVLSIFSERTNICEGQARHRRAGMKTT